MYPFLQMRKNEAWDTEKLSNMSKVTQLSLMEQVLRPGALDYTVLNEWMTHQLNEMTAGLTFIIFLRISPPSVGNKGNIIKSQVDGAVSCQFRLAAF